MSISVTLVFSLLAGAPGAESRANGVSSADVAKARELVLLLADTKFRVRNAAEKELIVLGLASLDALKEGESNLDPHVQERCRQLQPTIRFMMLQKRIDAFLADPNGPLPKNLPFLASFMKITKDSKESRQLYVELMQSHSGLMDDIENDRTSGHDQFTAFCLDVANRTSYRPGVDYASLHQSITKTDVALYFLLTAEFKQRASEISQMIAKERDPAKKKELMAEAKKYRDAEMTGLMSNAGYSFLHSPHLTASLGKNTAAEQPLKVLFLEWLQKEPQPWLVHRGLQIGAEANMKEILPLILKFMKDKDAAVYTRAQAALVLIKMGNKEHIKDVAPLLEDKTVIGAIGINNVQGQVQMRDVALAVSIKLSGQKIADYDFDVMKGGDDFIYQSYIYCAFSSDAKRDAAHKKYRESLQKKNAEKKDAEKKGVDKKDTEKKDTEKKVVDKKNTEKKELKK